MLVLDAAIKSINKVHASTQAKKVSKKSALKSRFGNALAEAEQSVLSSVSAIQAINTFLVLQETSEREESQAKLKESGAEILNCLNDIRFSLLNDRLSKQYLVQLKQVVEKNNNHFNFPDLQQVMNAIILRAEVELAKMEMNCSTHEESER